MEREEQAPLPQQQEPSPQGAAELGGWVSQTARLHVQLYLKESIQWDGLKGCTHHLIPVPHPQPEKLVPIKKAFPSHNLCV